MMNGKYRMMTTTMAVFYEEGRHIARPLPAGSVIIVENVSGKTLVEVLWEGKKILMFPQDIQARAQKLDDGSP
jgi:hypothetical protein